MTVYQEIFEVIKQRKLTMKQARRRRTAIQLIFLTRALTRYAKRWAKRLQKQLSLPKTVTMTS